MTTRKRSLVFSGPALRRARRRAGLTQAELASRCREGLAQADGSPRARRMTRARVARWEAGRSEPSTTAAFAAAHVLGVGPEDFHRQGR